jgi:hypothetical protein
MGGIVALRVWKILVQKANQKKWNRPQRTEDRTDQHKALLLGRASQKGCVHDHGRGNHNGQGRGELEHVRKLVRVVRSL